MPTFGERSMANLNEAHPDLQRLFLEVVKHVDCMVIEGYRSPEEQEKLFHAGKSKIKSGGKHNVKPSLAVDVVPYPVDWNDYKRFFHFMGVVQGIAYGLGIKIRCGGDWSGDNIFNESFLDLPHFELA